MTRSPLQWALLPLQRYAQFNGRSPRAEYWWFALFNVAISMALTIIDIVLVGFETVMEYSIGPLSGAAALVLLLPSLAVSFRRLHDLGRSAWWLLLGLVPFIGALVLLYWYVQRGTPGPNRFGEDPLVA